MAQSVDNPSLLVNPILGPHSASKVIRVVEPNLTEVTCTKRKDKMPELIPIPHLNEIPCLDGILYMKNLTGYKSCAGREDVYEEPLGNYSLSRITTKEEAYQEGGQFPYYCNAKMSGTEDSNGLVEAEKKDKIKDAETSRSPDVEIEPESPRETMNVRESISPEEDYTELRTNPAFQGYYQNIYYQHHQPQDGEMYPDRERQVTELEERELARFQAPVNPFTFAHFASLARPNDHRTDEREFSSSACRTAEHSSDPEYEDSYQSTADRENDLSNNSSTVISGNQNSHYTQNDDSNAINATSHFNSNGELAFARCRRNRSNILKENFQLKSENQMALFQLEVPILEV